MLKQSGTRILLVLIAAFYLLNGISYLRSQSVTADENSFYLYAKRWARGHPERVDPATDDSKTPIVALNLLPRAIVQVLHPGLHKNDNGVTDLINGRYMTLFFSLLTMGLVFFWARECFGERAGVFAVFLLSLEPSFLANAALVTTDAYSAFFLLAVMYSLWKCLSLRSWRWVILFSAALAGAQLVKQSLAHLYPVVLIVILADAGFRRNVSFKRLIRPALLFLFIQWFVINLGYYFFGTGTRLGDYHFFSDLFLGLQRSLPAGLPVPFPRPFVQAFDMTRHFDEIGTGIRGISCCGAVNILGHRFPERGIWYYYFVSLIFKAPVSFMILMVWAVSLTVIRKFPDPRLLLCLLAPAGYFLIYFSFFYKVQIGIRHIVFLVPPVSVFLSSVWVNGRPATTKVLLPLLSIYLIASHLYYWRAQYSYTNEFISNKTFAFRYVGSSNIDYGQGKDRGEAYLRTHPDVQWADTIPRAGRFLIPVQAYMDIYNEHRVDWLNAHPPYGHVAFSNLLVEVKPRDLR